MNNYYYIFVIILYLIIKMTNDSIFNKNFDINLQFYI